MNETINPPCNSILATFFELSFGKCLKEASSFLKRLVSLKRTLSQFLKLLFPLPLLMSPKEKLFKREAQSPVGGPKGPNEVGGVSETEGGTETKMRTLVLLAPMTWLGSLGTSLRVSLS